MKSPCAVSGLALGALCLSLAGCGGGGGSDSGGGQAFLDINYSSTFENTVVGRTSAPKLITLTNTGDGKLTFTSLPLSSGAFTQTANNCPKTLSPGQACTLTYVFQPTSATYYDTYFQIVSNAYLQFMGFALKGTGVAAAATTNGSYKGTDTRTGLEIVAMVADGQLQIKRSDGVQYSASMSEGVRAEDAPFINGLILQSNVQGSKFVGEVSALAGQGKLTTISFTASKIDQSSAKASIASISGNYADANSGAVLTVSDDGSVFSQDSETGCVLNGQVSTSESDPTIAVFEFVYANCTDDKPSEQRARGLAVLVDQSGVKTLHLLGSNQSKDSIARVFTAL